MVQQKGKNVKTKQERKDICLGTRVLPNFILIGFLENIVYSFVQKYEAAFTQISSFSQCNFFPPKKEKRNCVRPLYDWLSTCSIQLSHNCLTHDVCFILHSFDAQQKSNRMAPITPSSDLCSTLSRTNSSLHFIDLGELSAGRG